MSAVAHYCLATDHAGDLLDKDKHFSHNLCLMLLLK